MPVPTNRTTGQTIDATDINGIATLANTNETGVALRALKSESVRVVVHGSTAGTARPTGWGSVTWIGTVEPTNMTDSDLWIAPA